MHKTYTAQGLPLARIQTLASVLAEYGVTVTLRFNAFDVVGPTRSLNVARPVAEAKAGFKLADYEIK